VNHQPQLLKRVRDWLQKMPQLGLVYYSTYNLKTNRLESIFDFNTPTLTAQFSFNVNKDPHYDLFLGVLKNFAYMIGNPLATIQKREIKTKVADVLCIPTQVFTYGL